ncbi:MAG: hypothetical protein RIR22_618, partial [Planctomycetota bacterium]
MTSEQLVYVFFGVLTSAGLGFAIATYFYRTKLNI